MTYFEPAPVKVTKLTPEEVAAMIRARHKDHYEGDWSEEEKA